MLTDPAATFRIETDGPALPSHGRYGAGVAQPAEVDDRLRERMHAYTCIGVVLRGRFEFRTPLGSATVGAGAMIFGHAREEFSYRYLERSGARRCVIALNDDLVREAADYCGYECAAFPVAAIPPRRATAALYGSARRIASSTGPLEEEVLNVVSAALSIGREMRRPRSSARVRRRVRDVARYIDEAYACPMRLADMAAMVQLSKFHFLRAFSSEIGESPSRYLIAARLRAAADRLVDTNEPIAAVALNVGFNDLSHFNATFRGAFGASPRAWRNSVRGVSRR